MSDSGRDDAPKPPNGDEGESLPTEAHLSPQRRLRREDDAEELFSDLAEMEESLSSLSVLRAIDFEGDLGSGPLVEGEPEDSDSPPDREEKKFQLLEVLGVGGMGRVYLARDRDLNREVALKTVRESGSRLRARFLAEAQILGQLEHPNVVPIHELGLDREKRPFCTMRYVRGQTLERVLTEVRNGIESATRTYSLTRLVQIFLQVTQAVDYAHAKGVIHRDLKPENVMLGEHGEVQVLDWGLAKVLGHENGEDSLAQVPGDHTAIGQVVGTPGYMAPEQTLGEGTDQRSDIFSLGVILYQLLTLSHPFKRGSGVRVAMSVIRDEPRRPREAAPERGIPIELERICLQALEKAPEDRHQSVKELQAEIQEWLEAEADKAKRHHRAGELAEEGRRFLDEYKALKIEIEEVRRRVKQERESLEPWQPIGEKRELHRLEDQATKLGDQRALAASRVIMTVAAALGQEDSHPEARAVLADYFWDQFLDAEQALDRANQAYLGKVVAAFHDGRYARELQGDGTLDLVSDPSGAEVLIHDLVERDLQLVPGEPRELGTTPLEGISLPMGSYLLVVKKEGYRDVRYPVYVSRNRHWRGAVRLYPDREIGSGFVLIPGGPMVLGGDPGTKGWCLPPAEIETDDFFLSTHPVTMEEYLEFLNDLTAGDSDAATARAPRKEMGSQNYLSRDEESVFRLPDIDPYGHPMDPRLPVFGISWNDARAYCDWRSRRDGREYRLPTEEEWEKAARGVDGRGFPWGDRFDATLCNTSESQPDGPRTVSVDRFPTDVSIYGVRGMAGNAREWTGTVLTQGAGDKAVELSAIRGGAWEAAGTSDVTVMSRCAFRYLLPIFYVNPAISFRLAVTSGV